MGIIKTETFEKDGIKYKRDIYDNGMVIEQNVDIPEQESEQNESIV